MKFGYEIYLDNKLISDSNIEYESEYEAESEGNFEISSLADCYDRHWSEFTLSIINY